jgi:carotenoid cleavage dioxygenase-like enzyme
MTTAIPPEPLFGEEDRRIDAELNAERFNSKSVYNVPGYQPVRTELSRAPVRVTGKLPADLEGVYLRNGTNVQFDPTYIRSHAFAGAGMIHQIQIAAGAATYSNFYVRTPRFEFERRAGREVFVDFSDIAGGGRAAFDKIRLLEEKVRKGLIPAFSPYELTPASTSIRYHSGRLYCLQEQGYAFVLDVRSEDGMLVLDGRGRVETWEGEWEGPFSAHPRFDPATGDMYNLSLDGSGRVLAGRISHGLRHSQAQVHRFDDATGSTGWLHDFFLTENHLVFADNSVRLDPGGLLGQDGSVFRFDPGHMMRWGVLPRDFRDGDTVQWFTTRQPGMVWHVINAWERARADGPTEIVLYSPCFGAYPSSVPIHTPEEPPAQVKTWVLDLAGGQVTDERLLIDHGYERPSLNLGFVGSSSRYCYLLDEHGDGYMGKGVLKYDLIDEKEIAYLDYGDMYGGEALFIPRAQPRSEDDGYLLDLLMADDRADLIIIDARTMTETARLHLPQRVPFGVHASWLDSDDLTALGVS